MPRLIVVTLFALNLVILAGVMLQKSAEKGGPARIPVGSAPELPPITLVAERPASANLPIEKITAPKSECFSIGQFASLAELEQARSLIEPAAVFVSTRETYAFVQKGHWVYIPPFESRDLAREAVKRLTESGVDDLYIVPEGSYAGAISLGVFRSKQGAATRKSEIEALAAELEVMIGRYGDNEQAYWLDYELMAGLDNPANDWLAQAEGIESVSHACPPE